MTLDALQHYAGIGACAGLGYLLFDLLWCSLRDLWRDLADDLRECAQRAVERADRRFDAHERGWWR